MALASFVDSDGVLRVGGRLAKSHYSYSKKHPALLNGRHKLSKLILKDEHFRLQHAGPQLLLNSVRETYWPTNANVAKSIIRNCATCFKTRPRTITPIMADLPENRVTVSSPFTNVGVDYAGPFLLKDRSFRKGRGENYQMFYLFICLLCHKGSSFRVSDGP